VHQQQPTVEVKQQVLATAPHTLNDTAYQCLRQHAQRPSQRFPNTHGLHRSTSDCIGKTAPCDLNLGQLWHGEGKQHQGKSSWIIMAG
jgi:hypothetical protein